jgi:hypothetical protein
VVVLAAWPGRDRTVVTADGATTRSGGDAPGERMAVLDRAAAGATLAAVAQRGTRAAVRCPAGPSDPGRRDRRRPCRPFSTVADSAAAAADGADTVVVRPTPASVAMTRRPLRSRAGLCRSPSWARRASPAAGSPRPLRAKSLELLVYLAVQGGAATVDAILDDLLADAPARKVHHWLHTYVSDLRAALRGVGGPGNYLTRPGHRYVLNRELIDVDLWRMRAAIRAAQTAEDPGRPPGMPRPGGARLPRGALADGCDYERVEAYREGCAGRRWTVDATLTLVDALDGQPAEQMKVLTAPIGHHQYTEALYRAARRAHAQAGDFAAARRSTGS